MPTSVEVLNLLLPLPISHPSVSPLLAHRPLAYASVLPTQVVSIFLNRINGAVLGKEGLGERRAGYEAVVEIVRMDQEGWVLGEYGKGWIGAALASIVVSRSVHSISL
jgi:hypothetical protein